MALAAIAHTLFNNKKELKFAGLLLTCGVEPPKEIMEMLRQAEIPVIGTQQDSYKVVSRVSQMDVKISPADKNKIAVVNDTVRRHVDVDTLFKLL